MLWLFLTITLISPLLARLQWFRGRNTLPYSSCNSQRGSEGESDVRPRGWNKNLSWKKNWSWSRAWGIVQQSKVHRGLLERFLREQSCSQVLFIYSQPSSSFFISSLWHPIKTWETFRWDISSGVFPGSLVVENMPANAGDVGYIPRLGISPEEEMAAHSSIHAWRIPWMEKPGGLESMGSQRVTHNWSG